MANVGRKTFYQNPITFSYVGYIGTWINYSFYDVETRVIFVSRISIFSKFVEAPEKSGEYRDSSVFETLLYENSDSCQETGSEMDMNTPAN